ncbi:MAG: hypothetical protein KDA51_18130 [Planctomycetales bacterium]|nr:hypothetical protein [Planctomycetales bacterium]
MVKFKSARIDDLTKYSHVMIMVVAAFILFHLSWPSEAYAGDFPPPALAEKLALLAGPDATRCDDAGDAENEILFQCAEHAIASSQPFSVAIRLTGTDTTYWSAAAGSQDGSLWEVIYDTNPSGLIADTPWLKSQRCKELRFNLARFPYILCVPWV